jgi:hypothetical protein
MEEQEIPIDQIRDKIDEEAEMAKMEQREKWTLHTALSTACIAVLAAIAGLLSGHHVNEALIQQIKASDQWNFYQAKSIKSEIATSTSKILGAYPGAKPQAEDAGAVARYEKEKEEIKKQAEEFQHESEKQLGIHVTLSKAVTIFQIAIAIAAIAILTRKRALWYGSITLTLIGAIFLFMGIFG